MTDIREQVAKALFEDGYKPAKWFDATPSMKTDFRHIASVAITAYEKARGINEGGANAIVPREPTKAMIKAGADENWRHKDPDIADIYRAMLAASQKDTDT